MLRISKLTDYALIICSKLGEADGLASVSSLASDTQIPAPTVSKVLKQLVHARVVESVRGAHGGYRLVRRPNVIGVDEIIAAIEGPIAVTECSDVQDEPICEYEPTCDLSSNWKKINHAVQNALSKITVADMVSPRYKQLIPIDRLLRQRDRRAEPGVDS